METQAIYIRCESELYRRFKSRCALKGVFISSELARLIREEMKHAEKQD